MCRAIRYCDEQSQRDGSYVVDNDFHTPISLTNSYGNETQQTEQRLEVANNLSDYGRLFPPWRRGC